MDKMAQRIHERRVCLDMTMEELAKKVGVQKAAVSKWENGLVSNIPRSRVQLLATALNCDPVWLMGIDEAPRDIPPIAPGTAELIDLFSRATPEQRQAVINLLRSFVSDQE